MLSLLKRIFSKKIKASNNNWRILNGDNFKLSYPNEYTELREGGSQITGFCRQMMGEIIGVLRFTPVQLNKSEEANSMFLSAMESNPQGAEITIGNHKCWKVTEEKKHSSTDYIFWRDRGEPILMETYFFTDKSTLFLFTYRIPLSMTKNGLYSKEKPIVTKIIESTMAK